MPSPVVNVRANLYPRSNRGKRWLSGRFQATTLKHPQRPKHEGQNAPKALWVDLGDRTVGQIIDGKVGGRVQSVEPRIGAREGEGHHIDGSKPGKVKPGPPRQDPRRGESPKIGEIEIGSEI